jgi:3-oxoacyl-[acyl-carrier protein] reductase
VKNIIITGASGGLGKELTRIAAGIVGYRVIAVARNLKSIDSIKAVEGSEIVCIPVDLSVEENVDGLVQHIFRFGWSLDGLILSAAAFEKTDISNFRWANLENLFRINCFAPFSLCTKLSTLIAPGGHIVLVSSMGGYQGSAKYSGNSGYCMSKGAMNIMGECLSSEFSKNGILVNVVCPGAIKTDMLRKAFPDYDGGVAPDLMANWLWNFFESGRFLFNGAVLPVTKSSI